MSHKKFYKLVIVFHYIACFVIATMAICCVYHLMVPEELYFLSEKCIHEIQIMLIAALMGKAIGCIITYIERVE